MATFVNFTSLVSDVTTYLERGQSQLTDQTVYNQIPRLINAAERKIAQFLKLQGILEVLVDPTFLQAGVSVITKPDRWRQTVSMSYGAAADSNQRIPIYPRSYEYLRRYWPDDSVQGAIGTLNSSGLPVTQVFYADYDYTHWIVGPTPDNTYPGEVICYMQPPLLDNTNQNNFFTQETPNMLLYGALLEAAPFLKGDERIQVWTTYWEKELQSLSGQDLQKILDRSAERRSA